jgi:hypothetical protein
MTSFLLDNWFSILSVLANLVIVLVGFHRVSKKNAVFEAVFKATIETKVNSIDERLARVETSMFSNSSTSMIQKKSPLSLTPYAQKVFGEIGFDSIFDKIKDELLKDLENLTIRTPYDVQEKASIVIRRHRDDPIFDELKTVVYKTGNNLDEVLAAAFIPLRDYYFEKHPDIVK